MGFNYWGFLNEKLDRIGCFFYTFGFADYAGQPCVRTTGYRAARKRR